MTNCRGSWVVGGGRGSWVWVWVKVVGIKKSRGYQKNPSPKKKHDLINRTKKISLAIGVLMMTKKSALYKRKTLKTS